MYSATPNFFAWLLNPQEKKLPAYNVTVFCVKKTVCKNLHYKIYMRKFINFPLFETLND